MDDDTEAFVLLLLADSSLPTGSFVASAGLESYVAHGFASSAPPLHSATNFIRDSLASYARSALPFVHDAHRVVASLGSRNGTVHDSDIAQAIEHLRTLDDLYESMTLNHVARRASKTQGVALLTLYSKGFSKPSLSQFTTAQDSTQEEKHAAAMLKLVDRYKLAIRREETQGHLPTCWAVLTAALGLSLERSRFLHLFLHARSLLSASVRLNTLGPYAAQQLLLHAVRPLVQAEANNCKALRTGCIDPSPNDFNFDDTVHGPAVTWPLGEILAARHDLQHSRIFNS
ncbi:hypothetical protein GLOTRDRAFT_70374 [Gloeophyllum trabeum ATCC 11539]|uniref:Urease accessory protein UreF n=1 Tax=Gloeophyllum trabeum (strain ATCC 11539 / FP-39264 / Madison 617) TaxID=670483 RepID=S7S0D2_GLOTA|nr:uncharacterized protein GLOTRDRAFT_70374 [Gloeophyllum trabeum ATCC 11539]EPQ59174.1 hypothetical protein GLOTRDRAFT_70374 [Gloeophyllum trabeum ATCC 11539]